MNHKKNLIILSIIFIILTILTWGKTGNILIDFSRESYIPYQINNGEKLYKDIFIVYGPFGYIINALLYKISTNINLLILEAHLISYGIVLLFYYILNIFFAKKVSFIFTIFFLLISVFTTSTFTFTQPYSFSTFWSVFGLYVALYSLLYNKNKLLFLALGLVLSAKIEFFIPAFIISISVLFAKRKNFLKDFFLILIFPSVTILYLLINQITLNDIIQNANYIKTMVQTKAIASLYKGMGCFYLDKYFKFNITETFKLVAISALSYLFWIIKKPSVSYGIAIIGFIFLNNLFALNLGVFMAIFFTLIAFKNKNITKDETILFFFALILCSKSIFALNPLGYSNFGYCLIIYYLFLQLQKIVNKKWLINILIIFLVFITLDSLNYMFNNNKTSVNTPIGKIWVEKKQEKIFKGLNQFIKKYTNKEETFIILPEGQIFNLIHKKPHDFYNSTFTPLDFETFKDENLTKQLNENQTDYIIFYPRDTKEYGAESICYDYGVDFCKYIIDNYTRVGIIKDEQSVLIYKIKK